MKTYKINDVTLSETELRKLIKENPELKEEKRSRWKPENGGEYWYVNCCGGITKNSWQNDIIDLFQWRSGNCFKTEEEVQKALERIEAINTVTLAIEELNEGWLPDWKDNNQLRYYIYYNYNVTEFRIACYTSFQDLFALPYIKSGKIADQIIKEHEEELKIIFEI